MQLRLSFEHGAILDGLPGWREVFALPPPERMAALRTRRPAAGSTPGRSRTRRDSAAPRRVGPPDHRRDLRPRERAARRPQRRGGRARSAAWRPSTPCSTSWWPTVCAPGLHRPARVRGGLGAARRGLAGPRRSSVAPTPAPTSTPCAAPSTPRPCWATGWGARPAQLGGGGPPADRRSRPALRAARPRPARAGASPTWWCSTRRPSATGPSGPATTCPVAPPPYADAVESSGTCW